MTKKKYVAPGILLFISGGDPGGELSAYNPDTDPSLGAKEGGFDDFDDYNENEFTMDW